ncbi:hypothetical protein ABG067_000415 [Albugo candida]
MSDLVWEQYDDESSGRAYYYNKKTGLTTWERPDDYQDSSRSVPTTPEHADGGSRTMDAALSWKQYIDEATGKPYYFNEISKRTQWNRPDSDKIQIVEYFTDTDQEPSRTPSQEPQEHETRAAQKNHNNKFVEANDDLASTKSSQGVKAGRSPWIRYIDKSTEKPYFFNTITHITQWTTPPSFVEAGTLIVPPITPVDQIEKKEDTATTLQDANSEYMAYLSRKHQEQLRVATQRALDPNGHLQKLDSLLDHIDKRQNDTQSEKESKNEVKATSIKWVQYIDPTSQSVYYYNMDTGKKQYDMPNDHVVSGLADWIPAEAFDDNCAKKDELVDGVHYTTVGKLNRVTGKYEKFGGQDYWDAVGIAPDRAGRQMSQFFDITQLEENRKKAVLIKEQLKRKNINWKKVNAEKKAKKQKRNNKWLFED